MKKIVLALCFVVISTTSLMAQNVINDEVKKAMKELSSVVFRQINVSINEITMAGTKDMTSEFSVYLYPIIEHHAITNSNSMFNVVNVPRSRGLKTTDGQSTGVISGTYNTRGNTVEVYLNLNIDGSLKSSYRFTIPISELDGISTLPANYKTKEEAIKQDNAIAIITGTANQTNQTNSEKQQPVSTPTASPTAQNINIQAWFDSKQGNRNYMHREPLEITVMADKDCYFKIIHVDANNQIKMIYPTKNKKNFLSANKNFRVFDENDKYMFYGPYGEERIFIVASLVQFTGIEQEYNQPWKAATDDMIKKAIAGDGIDSKTINILKPHEEYEYIKPQNMTATYQAIRDNAEKQGGKFQGNAESGFYEIDNVRGSYRVIGDKIQFAYYSIYTYNGNTYSETRMRGQPYNFSFAKPQNISEAVQTVQTGIKNKGGTFTGDEQQGNFKASGIAGQYKITEVVNVTISEKPIVIPNSLIENEVKNFFGVR